MGCLSISWPKAPTYSITWPSGRGSPEAGIWWDPRGVTPPRTNCRSGWQRTSSRKDPARGAVHSDRLAVYERFQYPAYTHNRWQTDFTRRNRAMGQRAATFRHHCRRPVEERCPGRVGGARLLVCVLWFCGVFVCGLFFVFFSCGGFVVVWFF